jgi:hypothetical protein
MSQQRFHVHDASLPSPGSPRARVPLLQWYYQGTATSCRPSRHTSCSLCGQYHGGTPLSLSTRRGAASSSPELVTRYLLPGHAMETTGSPKFLGNPHVRLRMVFDPGRPDCLRPLRGVRMAPAVATTKAPTSRIFRGSIAWLSDSLPTYHVTVTRRTAQGWLPGAGQALLDGLSTRRAPVKGFQLTSCSPSSFPKLLGTMQHVPQRDWQLATRRVAPTGCPRKTSNPARRPNFFAYSRVGA